MFQLAAQLQQEHALALERLRATLNLEKEEAMNVLRREAETDRQRRDDSYRQDLERREAESKKQMEKVIGDMEKKREQVGSLVYNLWLEETITGRLDYWSGINSD